MPETKSSRIKPGFLHRWHRRLGIVSAVFVVLLVITGILLNHSGRLGLDRHYVQISALLDWYRVAPPEAPVAFEAGGHTLSRMGKRLYWNEKELGESANELIGAVAIDDTIVAAIPGHLLLLTQTGELIERLGGADGVPAGMTRIGRSQEGQLVISAAHGDYTTGLDVLEWTHLPATSDNTQWAEPSQPSVELQEHLLNAYRGKGLPLDRVLLDLHSGRILGAWGVYLVDGAAIFFLILAASGIWMWLRRV